MAENPRKPPMQSPHPSDSAIDFDWKAAAQLKKIEELLKSRDPNLNELMQVTLQQEKEMQERRDKKVLTLIAAKDRDIAALTAHLKDLSQKASTFDQWISNAENQKQELMIHLEEEQEKSSNS